MKLTKNIKIILVTLMFFIVLIVFILRISDVLRRKYCDYKYKPFFEQKEDFDVLFMGTSHIIDSAFPMELWNDYGIVSYNFGGYLSQIPTTYWVTQNVLDYTSPKLIVIDLFCIGGNSKTTTDHIHFSIDYLPFSIKKIRGIFDLYNDRDTKEQNIINSFEYFWDFIKYHPRWKEINKNDFINEDKSKTKGAELLINVNPSEDITLISKTAVIENETVGMQYLRKIIIECLSKNINVLLVYIPHSAGQIEANSGYKIAEEYNINYINFFSQENLINFKTDWYDGGGHLNCSGAKKISDYLGKYIKDHYDIPDRRKDENYKSWFADYEDYVDYKISNINTQTNIENVLMLLFDKDFSVCMYFKKNSQILKQENIQVLLENMAGKKLSRFDEVVRTNSSYYLVVNSNEKIICESTGEDFQNIETSFGSVSFFTQDGIPNLQLKSDEANILYGDWYSPESDEPEPDVQIFVINNRTKEIVSTSCWDFVQQENIAKRK